MSLLSIDISKGKKLSLQEVKLPTLEAKKENNKQDGSTEIIRRITEARERITEAKKRITELRDRIKKYENESIRNEGETRSLEKTFREIAKGCKVKDYAPKFIKEPLEGKKIQELIYWTS